MPVSGVAIVVDNITKFSGNFLKHVNKVMAHVKDELDSEVTKNMSLKDHSLSDLRKMGHPYRIGGPGLHHPTPWQVHTQSGSLLGSKTSGTIDASFLGTALKAAAYVKLNESIAEHAKYVIWGTSKMIPRDFLSGSLFDPRFQAMVKQYISSNLHDLVVNFRGIETK